MRENENAACGDCRWAEPMPGGDFKCMPHDCYGCSDDHCIADGMTVKTGVVCSHFLPFSEYRKVVALESIAGDLREIVSEGMPTR